MDKIRGVNLGNWLVLEKWMSPDLFEGTGADDEIWLNRMLPAADIKERMRAHRDTYITKADFQYLSAHGLMTVRIPVPYFLFGDCPPFQGGVAYLDRALDWAEEYGMQILIDLHTVPGSQNGYDNGGITGVCKWCKDRDAVEFTLTVLERLAQRYGHRRGLFGIEVLNEPISLSVYLTAPSTGKARDKEEAKGSGYVPMRFLKAFYIEAYDRMRRYLPVEKAIVYHDGFRLGRWRRFFREQQMENVYLDTHIYISAMESFIPCAGPWIYRLYIAWNQWQIRRMQDVVPVIVGEWCICNRYADRDVVGLGDAERERTRRERYQQVYEWQRQAWESSAGWFYWNYELVRDMDQPMDEAWKESWDLRRCLANGWIPQPESGRE